MDDPPTLDPETSDNDPGRDSVDDMDSLLRVAYREPAPPDGEMVGQYRLLGELGRGGQGTVHLAEDTSLQRRVALKVLSSRGRMSGPAFARFQREAQIASRLDHPGICTVYDSGVSDGVPFIAMRLVEGRPLSRIHEGEPTRLDTEAESDSITAPTKRGELARIVGIFARAARALHAAHLAGIIHRDVKPGNIMLTADDTPIVLDFGLARDEDQDTLTQSGEMFGTPSYMSPEQIRFDGVPLDAGTDVWALGVSLYECLAGQRPFHSPTREALYRAILSDEPRPIRSLNPMIPGDVAVIVHTAITKERGARYATAAALADDLEAFLEGRSIAARPPSVLGRLMRWTRRQPAMAALLLVLLAGLPAMAVLVTNHLRDRKTVRDADRLLEEQRKEELLTEAFLDLGEGRFAEAERRFRRALALPGSSEEAWAGLLEIEFAQRRGASAGALLEISALMGTPEEVFFRARILSAQGKQSEADELFLRWARADSPFALFLRARQFTDRRGPGRSNRLRQAVRMLDQAARLSRRPRALFQLERLRVAGMLKDVELLRDSLAATERLWPTSKKRHWLRGWAMFECGLTREALREFERGAKADPNDQRTHHRRAQILEVERRYRESLEASEEALRIAPDDTHVLVQRATTLHAVGRADEAFALLDKAESLDPEFAGTFAARGYICWALNRIDDATEALERSRELDPYDVVAITNLANIYLNARQLKRSEEMFRRALELNPDSGASQGSLGECLRRQGRLQEARVHYERAVALLPQVAQAWFSYGNGFYDGGAYDQARAAYQKAHDLGTTLPAEKFIGECERLGAIAREVEQTLLLGSDGTPKEMLVLARRATEVHRHQAAVRLFSDVFRAEPELANASGNRFLAVRSALRAAAGQGSEEGAPSVGARASLRREALVWMTEELASLQGAVEAGELRGTRLVQILERWSEGADLQSVRAPGLDLLPQDERAGWIAFWKAVEGAAEDAH